MNILILDDTLTQVSVLTNYVSLKFETAYNDFGWFEISANLNQKNADELEIGRIVYLDSMRCGIISSVKIARSDSKTGETIVAEGHELKDAVARRIPAVPQTVGSYEYTAQTPEYIIRDLIDKSFINPIDTHRKVDFFELGGYQGLGNEMDYEIRNLTLDKYIYEILLPIDELGLKCEVNLASKKAVYGVYRGLDRTVSQDVNPAAVFSLKLGTSKQNVVEKDISGMKNVVYVGNGYAGASEVIEEVYEGEVSSGLGRIEYFIRNTDAVTTADLVTEGKVVLKNCGQVMSVYGLAGSGEPNYGLGDKITFYDYGSSESMDLRIMRIHYEYSENQTESKTLVFGSAPLDISKAFNTKFTPLAKEYVK